MQRVQTVSYLLRGRSILQWKKLKSRPLVLSGSITLRIAEEGMIGMVWLNGGGIFLAPFGSADRRLRPEPIALSVPRRNGSPFMLDMTVTVVADGKIEQMLIRGEEMPDGWVIDPDGAYVSDPARYKEDPENTGVLPLGGMQFGHKGYGLGMMESCLSAHSPMLAV